MKEIVDPGRRRHQEYKDALAKAQATVEPKVLIRAYTPKFLTPLQIGGLVQTGLDEFRHIYAPRVQQSLDLVFYVNLLGTSLDRGPMPSPALFGVVL